MFDLFLKHLRQCLEFQSLLELSSTELERLKQTLQEFEKLYECFGEFSFSRSNSPAHFTASAFLVSLPSHSILLAKHKKLGKWLQLGGHIDSGEGPALAALRECSEESGLMQDLIQPLVYSHEAIPIDADIHPIPANKSEPSHLHFDLRYAFFTEQPKQIQVSTESEELAWVPLTNISGYSTEESLLRVVRILNRYFARHEQSRAWSPLL